MSDRPLASSGPPPQALPRPSRRAHRALWPLVVVLGLGISGRAGAAALPTPETRYPVGNFVAGAGLATIAVSSGLLLSLHGCHDPRDSCALGAIALVGWGVLPGVLAASIGTGMSYSGARRFGAKPSRIGFLAMAGGSALMVATGVALADGSDRLAVAVGVAAFTTTAAGTIGQLAANRAAVNSRKGALSVAPWATEATRGMAVGLRW